VAEDDDSAEYKVTLAQHIFGKAGLSGRRPPERKTPAAPPPMPAEPEADETLTPRGSPAAGQNPPAGEASPPAPANLAPVEAAAQHKQRKTAAELAEMIELDLSRHPDCPRVGFRVTVYGGSHWRAMLTITPAAGGIRNPREWRDLTDDLAERLRARYDLVRE
jgi:hypothetical protein